MIRTPMESHSSLTTDKRNEHAREMVRARPQNCPTKSLCVLPCLWVLKSSAGRSALETSSERVCELDTGVQGVGGAASELKKRRSA